MTQPETTTQHVVGPDGYCFTCQQVPCRGRAPGDRPQSPLTQQLNRIEAKLNRILRHIDGDQTDTTTPAAGA